MTDWRFVSYGCWQCIVYSFTATLVVSCYLATRCWLLYVKPINLHKEKDQLWYRINYLFNYRATHWVAHGYNFIPIPYPWLIGLLMGKTHGRNNRPIPCPFGSGAHEHPDPWARLPAWSISLSGWVYTLLKLLHVFVWWIYDICYCCRY
jgi:hypothetical protein